VLEQIKDGLEGATADVARVRVGDSLGMGEIGALTLPWTGFTLAIETDESIHSEAISAPWRDDGTLDVDAYTERIQSSFDRLYVEAENEQMGIDEPDDEYDADRSVDDDDYYDSYEAEQSRYGDAYATADAAITSAMPEDFDVQFNQEGNLGEWLIENPDGDVGRLATTIDGNVVHVDLMEFPESMQGSGVGTAVAGAVLSAAQQMGAAEIEFYANISVGGFAWARMGAYPTDDDWGNVQHQITSRLEMAESSGIQIDSVTRAEIFRIIDGDPDGLPDLAALDTKISVPAGQRGTETWRLDANGEIAIGKALLLGTSWNARMLVGDTEATRDFATYAQKKAEPRAAAVAGVLPTGPPKIIHTVKRHPAGAYVLPGGFLDDGAFWAEAFGEEIITRTAATAVWTEELHPRDERGRFGQKGEPAEAEEAPPEKHRRFTPETKVALEKWVYRVDECEAIRASAETYAETGTGLTPETRELLGWIDGQPRLKDVVYRGMAMDGTPEELEAKFAPGSEYHIALGSGSQYPGVAAKFAQWSLYEEPAPGGGSYERTREESLPDGARPRTEIIFRVEPGGRGADIPYRRIGAEMGDYISEEAEVLVRGDYTVASVERVSKYDFYRPTTDLRDALEVTLTPARARRSAMTPEGIEILSWPGFAEVRRPERTAATAVWEPELHPRDERGRFGYKGEGESLEIMRDIPIDEASMEAISELVDNRGVPLTDKVEDRVEKFFGTRQEITDRYAGLLEEARGTEQWDGGKGWYASTHDDAVAQAEHYQADLDTVAGVYAAISPGLQWTTEHDIVGAMLEMSEGTLDVSDERLAQLNTKLTEGYGLAPLENGVAFDELDERSAVMAMREQFMERPPEERLGGWPAPYGYESFMEGLRVIRGASPDEALNGVKIRSFYNNILEGGGDDVTVDVMMMRAARPNPKEDPPFENSNAVTGTPSYKGADIGVTPLLADVVRDLAAENDLTPSQAQAIIWVQWKKNAGTL
jgi:hypothetical protein